MANILRHCLTGSDDWDGLVRSGDYQFFHATGWAEVLMDAYGFTPRYLSLSDPCGFSAFPLMLIPSPWGHPHAVCLPFSDSCGPVWTSRPALDALSEAVVEMARSEGWTSLEVRGEYGLAGLDPEERFVEHIIDLTKDLQDIEASVRSSTMRNIHQAQRRGVQVRRCQSPEGMETYYRLHCITRKRQGVPPQPVRFFRAIQERLIAREQGFVLVAEHDGCAVAAAVYLFFGTRAIYKFGASVFDTHRLRPNNLIMWEAIQWLRDHGFTALSLGRTEPENEGLLQFKDGWGGVQRSLEYCKWPAHSAHSLLRPVGRRGAVRFLARRMPMPVLKLAGTIFYRYMG